MDLQALYFDDPLKLEFEAIVQRKIELPGGRSGVILDRTYFYPTGGGQEHDTGTLNGVAVVDVYKDETTRQVVHVVEGDLPLGMVTARIDRERRQRAMQHHTAQHLLTQCFLRLFDLETLSAHISGYSPSTLDLPFSPLEAADLERAEDLANQVIFEDRAVRTYFVSPAELSRVPLRKPPKVAENIRIVEIDSFDYSACGGTHCLSTGSIGLLKVLKAERQNDRLRITFIAGLQALETFRQAHAILSALAGELSVGVSDLPATVRRQAEQLRAAQKQLQALRLEGAAQEAQRLAQAGEQIGGRRVVLAAFDDRSAGELRALASEFKSLEHLVAVLASFDGQKLALAVASGEPSLSACALLEKLLAPFGGRGGGDASLAQGGGAAAQAQVAALLESARSIIRDMLA